MSHVVRVHDHSEITADCDDWKHAVNFTNNAGKCCLGQTKGAVLSKEGKFIRQTHK